MGDTLKQKLAETIELAHKLTNTIDEANIPFLQECGDLISKTMKLSSLLGQASAATSELYMQRPIWSIVQQTEHVLYEALSLVIKCCPANIKKRIFTIVVVYAFRKTSSQLENSIGDFSRLLRISNPVLSEALSLVIKYCPANIKKRIFTIVSVSDFIKSSSELENSIGDFSWLLRISNPDRNHDGEYHIHNHILPSVAFSDPIIALIWELIASLCIGSLEDRSHAAACLVSLANESDRYGKMIIEEGGVGPLLKLMEEGNSEGKNNAARAIGLLKAINSVVILITSASMRTPEICAGFN